MFSVSPMGLGTEQLWNSQILGFLWNLTTLSLVKTSFHVYSDSLFRSFFRIPLRLCSAFICRLVCLAVLLACFYFLRAPCIATDPCLLDYNFLILFGNMFFDRCWDCSDAICGLEGFVISWKLLWYLNERILNHKNRFGHVLVQFGLPGSGLFVLSCFHRAVSKALKMFENRHVWDLPGWEFVQIDLRAISHRLGKA